MFIIKICGKSHIDNYENLFHHLIMHKFFAGIDAGTGTTKAVIIDSDKNIVGSFVKKTGVDIKKSAVVSLENAATQAKISPRNIKNIVATGYGRKNIAFANSDKTEIACQAKGCFFFFSEDITIVDIGSQDTKIIKLNKKGETFKFKMNRKCAAGTGAFLEETAARLDIPLSDINNLAKKSKNSLTLGSYCTVFTKTEILDKIRTGEKIEDISKGLFVSIIKRIMEMDILKGKVVMAGGVIEHNPYIAEILKKELKANVKVPPHPQITCAFGAALFAANNHI